MYDPCALRDKAEQEYGISMLPDLPDLTVYDAIILAVGHDAFKTGIDFSFVKNQSTDSF